MHLEKTLALVHGNRTHVAEMLGIAPFATDQGTTIKDGMHGTVQRAPRKLSRASRAREEITSSNMANIDAPGYLTRDINFESKLNSAMSAASFRVADGTETPRNG
jgi:hypothetical protein